MVMTSFQFVAKDSRPILLDSLHGPVGKRKSSEPKDDGQLRSDVSEAKIPGRLLWHAHGYGRFHGFTEHRDAACEGGLDHRRLQDRHLLDSYAMPPKNGGKHIGGDLFADSIMFLGALMERADHALRQRSPSSKPIGLVGSWCQSQKTKGDGKDERQNR